MKKRALPILLVVALLLAALSVTAMAETKAAPADITQAEKQALSTAIAAIPLNGKGEAYCPVCKKTALWYSQGSCGNTKLDQLGNHWFIQGDVTNTGYYYVSASGTGCFYLNGFNVTSSSVAFETNTGSTLNIIGNGNEVVRAAGYGNYQQYGDTVHTYGGTTNLYGGIYEKSSADYGPVVGAKVAYTLNVYEGTTIRNGTNEGYYGGNIGLYAAGTTVNMYGGTVSDGQAAGGGNIGLYASDTSVNIYGGTVSGGKAVSGGNICAPSNSTSNCQINVSGGTVTGGAADKWGGNIYVYAKDSTVNLSGGEIKNGTATTMNGGNVCVESASTVNLSGATITGGTAGNWGGNCYGEGGAKYVMTAGTVQTGSAKYGGNFGINNAYFTFSNGTIKNGTASDRAGNLYLSGHVGGSIGGATITGGTLEGGSAVNGGSVFFESGCKVTMTNLTVTGGTASSLGGAFHVSNAQVTLDNCSISGGKASAWGGNIYADTANCVLTIKGNTTISGGRGAHGGNITINDKATLKIESGVISGGTAPNYGGNIYMNSGTLTQTGGTVKNGTSETDRGGNIYIASGVTANITGATYEGGKANVYGGNIFNNGTLTVTNTSITGGNAARGGNVHCASGATFINCTIQDGSASYGGNIRIDGTAQCAFTECTIKNGTASSGGGNMDARAACTFNDCTLEVGTGISGSGSQFYNEGTQTFNDCTLTNGTVMGDGNIVLNNTIVNMSNLDARNNSIVTLSGNTQVNKMTVSAATCGIYVKKDFTGTVNFASMVGTPDAPIYGKALGANFTAEGNFTGKLIPTFTLEEPWVCNKDGNLVFAASRIVNGDQISWYADGAAAVAAYNGNGYLWPAVDGTIPVNGNCTIDLAGTNQTITGTGTVTIFDSANKDYKTYGTATVTGPTVANTFATQVGGDTYYMVADGNAYSFHLLKNKVSGISIRPSSAGVYYTSTWACDDALKALIENFGVAVSLAGQIDANFATAAATLHTCFDKTEFASNSPKTSVLVNNIFTTEAQDNATRGQQPIYAAAYVTFNNGNVVVDTDGTNCSLHNVLSILETNIQDYSAQAATLQNFMAKWSEYGVTGENWNFDFAVAEEIKQLNALYAGLNAYQGELHDHAATGGNSDGKQPLQTWVDGMNKLKMDFATIVDHNQTRHMYLPEWQQATFIGGTEVSAWLKDDKAEITYPKIDMNLTFATVEQFEAFVDQYADLFKPEIDPETGGYLFKDPGDMKSDNPAYNVENFVYVHNYKQYVMELAQAVLDHGGFFTHVHPTSPGYMASTDPLDYWFGDFTGMEVQYTGADDRNGTRAQNNYKLWTTLLAMGKKIYATAGNDRHNMPSVNALTTINASENTAVALVEQLRTGNFNPGPVGIRMSIGDTRMGGVTDFTGKKLAFVIGNIHESELADGEHNYKVVLFKDSQEVQRWDMPATGENFYQVVEIDADADFYRLEVIDIEGDTIDRVALSQPIWNEK